MRENASKLEGVPSCDVCDLVFHSPGRPPNAQGLARAIAACGEDAGRGRRDGNCAAKLEAVVVEDGELCVADGESGRHVKVDLRRRHVEERAGVPVDVDGDAPYGRRQGGPA